MIPTVSRRHFKSFSPFVDQGCQMAYFQTKIPFLGTFLRVLQWKVLVYFMAIRFYLNQFGTFCGHWVNFMGIWYIFPVLVCCPKEKSGYPVVDSDICLGKR
jgi:hypothetical protein